MKYFRIISLIIVIGVIILSFNGVRPFSDVKNNVVAWFNENISSIDLSSDKPSGTYYQTILGYEMTLTFSGNKVTFFDSINGQRVYIYELHKDATTGEYNSISLTDPATGKTTERSFKYLKEVNGVRYNGTDYYK